MERLTQTLTTGNFRPESVIILGGLLRYVDSTDGAPGAQGTQIATGPTEVKGGAIKQIVRAAQEAATITHPCPSSRLERGTN